MDDDLARAVLETVQLDDQVDRAGDLLADCLEGQVQTGHEHQRFEPREGLARAVRMDGGQRAVVAGVHRLEHVERLTATALSNDDAIGTHAQRVDDQLADRDAALAVDVGRTSLETADMLLVQLQLGRILDGDDALVDRDETRADVEKSRLAGTRATGHQDVRAREHACLDERGGFLGHGAEPDEVGNLIRVLAELSNRENGTVERDRRYRRVDAGSVEQARVHEWRARIDAPTDRRADGVDHPHQVSLVIETDVGEEDLALALHVDHLWSVDHDLGQAVVIDQWTQGAESLEVPAVELLRDGCHAHVRMLLGFRTEGGSAPIVCATAGRSDGSNRFDTRSIPAAFQTSTTR